MTKQRFEQWERKMQKPENKVVYEFFRNEMRQEMENGWIIPIPPHEIRINEGYFVPYHTVEKESATTPIRIVYDFSMKTRIEKVKHPNADKLLNQMVRAQGVGRSLNDALMVAPRIQETIFGIQISMRTKKLMFTGDIKKMFKQIKVHRDDWKYMKIVWRPDMDSKLQQYYITYAAFGTSASPGLAANAILCIAEEQQKTYPLAYKTLTAHTYVDDTINGADTVEELKKMVLESKLALATAKMELRKIKSNTKLDEPPQQPIKQQTRRTPFGSARWKRGSLQ